MHKPASVGDETLNAGLRFLHGDVCPLSPPLSTDDADEDAAADDAAIDPGNFGLACRCDVVDATCATAATAAISRGDAAGERCPIVVGAPVAKSVAAPEAEDGSVCVL